MKKFIILALVSLMTLTSCKNNNKDSSSENTVSDTAATTSADTVQAEKSTETGKSTTTESRERSPIRSSSRLPRQAPHNPAACQPRTICSCVGGNNTHAQGKRASRHAPAETELVKQPVVSQGRRSRFWKSMRRRAFCRPAS